MNARAHRLLLAAILGLTWIAAAALVATAPSGAAQPPPPPAGPPGARPVWRCEVVDSEGDVGRYSSLVLDSAGNPHIAYYDGSHDAVKYATRSGAGWTTQTLETSAVGPSLGVDRNAIPHVAYTHRGPYVKYAVLTATGWISETVQRNGFAGPSLALDAAGWPHVAYSDVKPRPPEGPGHASVHAYRTLGGWVRQDVDEAMTEQESLALDSAGNPTIAYHDIASDTLKVAFKGAGGWVFQVIESGGQNPSLKLDRLNVPHIAYTYAGPSVKYAVLSATGWISETADYVMAASPSLALDAQGNPHIAYCDVRPSSPAGAGKGLKYAYKIPAGWAIQTVDTTQCESASIVLDQNGRPHISYYDVANQDLKYAYIPYRIYLPMGIVMRP